MVPALDLRSRIARSLARSSHQFTHRPTTPPVAELWRLWCGSDSSPRAWAPLRSPAGVCPTRTVRHAPYGTSRCAPLVSPTASFTVRPSAPSSAHHSQHCALRRHAAIHDSRWWCYGLTPPLPPLRTCRLDYSYRLHLRKDHVQPRAVSLHRSDY